MMEYKGYIGRVEIDDEAGVIHGEVVNTRDVITFQGQSLAEVKQAFHESVDDYLEFCEQRGEAPDKPFSGQFVARIPPELHRKINHAAILAGKSLNAWVTEKLQGAVHEGKTVTAIGESKLMENGKRKRKSATRTGLRRKTKS